MASNDDSAPVSYLPNGFDGNVVEMPYGLRATAWYPYPYNCELYSGCGRKCDEFANNSRF